MVVREQVFGLVFGGFAPRMANPADVAGRRASMQDFRTFPSYLTEEIWGYLEQSPPLPQMNRMERLTRFMVNVLGLRHPSEPTMALMCALICRSERDASRLAAALQTLKTVLKMNTVRATQQGLALPGGLYLEVLPSAFAELPDVVRRDLASVAFVAPPETVNVDEVMQLSRGIPLRATHRAMTLQRQMQQSVPFGSSGSAASQLVEAAAIVASAVLRAPMLENNGGLTNLQFFPRDGTQRASGAQNRQLQNLLERHEASATCAVPVSPEAGPAPLAIMDALPSHSQPGAPAVPRKGIEAPPDTTPLTGDVLQEAPAMVSVQQEVQPLESVLHQEAVQQAPSQVAASVEKLARAHYGVDLDTSKPQPQKKRGRPPNALKRPAAAETQLCKMRKPAAAASSHADLPSEKAKPVARMKKPAAEKAAKQVKTSAKKSVTKAQRVKLRPNGCSTCRHMPGCCPSCWKKQGYEVLS